MWATAAAADSLARRITSATMASRVVVERLLLLRYPAAEERFGVKEKDRMGTRTLALNQNLVAR